MKHRTFTAALGLLMAALVAAGTPSPASAADPSGIWAKDDGMAKMEIKKCGRRICSKIVWLKDPTDSRGRPLHDVRNEDPSMRDRPILGLPLFSNMAPTERHTWVGDVYNPEEGHIYTNVKVTMVSLKQIVLRGCKAWLLCGEKSWTRTTLPAPAAEPEQQEAAAPAPAQPATPMTVAEAEAEDSPGPSREQMQVEANAGGPPEATESLPRSRAATGSDGPEPALPSPWQHAAVGYDVLLAAARTETVQPFSSASVSSMFVVIPKVANAGASNAMIPDAAVEPQVETRAAAPVPLPAAKPKPKPPAPQTTAEADAPAPTPVVRPKPKPEVKQPPEDLPWLQHP